MLLYVLGNNTKKSALQSIFPPLYITLYYHFFPHYSFPSHTAFLTTTTTISTLQQYWKPSPKILPWMRSYLSWQQTRENASCDHDRRGHLYCTCHICLVSCSSSNHSVIFLFIIIYNSKSFNICFRGGKPRNKDRTEEQKANLYLMNLSNLEDSLIKVCSFWLNSRL